MQTDEKPFEFELGYDMWATHFLVCLELLLGNLAYYVSCELWVDANKLLSFQQECEFALSGRCAISTL